jgi:integrating conjugative element relaxase (TIGR03760 family)
MAISRRIIKFFQAKVAVDKVDSELVQIQTANELLGKHKKLIDSIYHQSHVPKEHFKKLYLYSIERLAIWVQDLPASQNHHHSNRGGFLLHTLEVVEIAIKRRNTKMLPIGANAEKQNEKKDLWTFAIFVAALLHDIGKTISDVDIMLYDAKHKALGKWSPWFGRISDVSDAKYYQYQYNASRKYQQHSLLPLTLLSQFINPVAIDWMQKESDLFTLLLMSLQGRCAEGAIIADIVKYADSESSAKSLKNSNNSNSLKPNQPQLQTQIIVVIIIASCLKIYLFKWHFEHCKLYRLFEYCYHQVQLAKVCQYFQSIRNNQVAHDHSNVVAQWIPARNTDSDVVVDVEGRCISEQYAKNTYQPIRPCTGKTSGIQRLGFTALL